MAMKDQLLALADEILQSGCVEWSGRLRALASGRQGEVDYRARLATEVRSALGEFNDENEPVVSLVRALAENVRALAAKADQPAQGYRVVPEEPTEAMLRAVQKAQ